MPEDQELLQIGSSQLPPPFRGLHSPGVRKHCQIIFASYFRKSSILRLVQNNFVSASIQYDLMVICILLVTLMTCSFLEFFGYDLSVD